MATGRVLFGVDLAIRAGEVVTLLGRNGMGKTTTISAIMGIVRPLAGTVRLDGAAIEGSAAISDRPARAWPRPRRAAGLSEPDGSRKPRRDRACRAGAGITTRCSTCFRRCANGSPLPARLLSGGEQQMLAIGRALLTNPRLLLLDEATEGLAPRVRAEIWRVLARLKAAGQAILVIDKNIAPLLLLADRHYILDRGRTSGPAARPSWPPMPSCSTAISACSGRLTKSCTGRYRPAGGPSRRGARGRASRAAPPAD